MSKLLGNEILGENIKKNPPFLRTNTGTDRSQIAGLRFPTQP